MTNEKLIKMQSIALEIKQLFIYTTPKEKIFIFSQISDNYCFHCGEKSHACNCDGTYEDCCVCGDPDCTYYD